MKTEEQKEDLRQKDKNTKRQENKRTGEPSQGSDTKTKKMIGEAGEII